MRQNVCYRVANSTLYAFGFLAAVLLPLFFKVVLARLSITLTSQNIFSANHLLFAAWLLFATSGGRHYGRSRDKRNYSLCLAISGLYFLILIHLSSIRSSWDYAQIEKGAGAILRGQNPYQSGGYLFYPPFYGELFASLYLMLRAVLPQAAQADPSLIWNLIFYIFECAQFMALLLSFVLLNRTLQLLPSKRIRPHWLTFIVMVANIPLIETVQDHQINGCALACALGGIALVMYPLRSALFLAAGTALKVYPILIFVPLAAAQRWRPIFITVSLLAILVGLNFILGLAPAIFYDYFEHGRWYLMLNEHEAQPWMTNNLSLFSFLHNLTRQVAGHAMNPQLASSVVRIISATLFLWSTIRTFKRRSAHNEYGAFVDNCADWLSIGLFLSPMVWNMQYILATPVVAWTVIRCDVNKLPIAIIGGALVLLLPASFPPNLVMFHAPLGLLLLWFCRNVQTNSATRSSAQPSII